MLIVKSQMTSNSVAYDRIALMKPEQLPHVAKRRGWNHAILADERTMAGALRFLASAKAIGIKASAGVQVSRLRWSCGEMALLLVPLDQNGFERLIRVADRIANANKLESVVTILSDADRDELRGGRPDIVALALPRPDTDYTRPDALLRLPEIMRAARLGPIVALADAGPNREPLGYAPQQAAADLSKATGIPLARATFGYMEAKPDPDLARALMTIATDSSGSSSLSQRERQPTTMNDPSIGPAEDREDAPAALATQIVDRIERMTLSRKPSIPAKLGLQPGEDAGETLRRLAEAGFERRLAKNQITDEERSYEQMQRELGIIVELGFSNYFVILEHAISFARDRNIPIGYGRGSAAGSMVVYCLGITNVDPIKHKLIFERFINPDRISLPDIDTDLCMLRRREVLEYLAETFGHERFAQIATYGQMQLRGAIQTAARVLASHGPGARLTETVTAIARQRDAKTPETQLAILREQITENPDPMTQGIARLASQLMGLAATTSVHAGGVVMADTPIREWAPLSAEKSEFGLNVVSTNMDDTEACGLVKYDLLGLTTLTMMRHATDALARDGIHVDLDAIPYDDQAVYEMIRKGRTKTVFQVESGGMAQAAREIAVSKLDDLSALVALYRPGPMGDIPKYAARKAGKAPIEYIHPCLEPILEDTYGIIVYQEQIMALSQAFAGYTMGQADVLRKAVGKKKKEDVDAARQPFYERAEAMGQDPAIAEELFDFIVPFARYGFNRAHAASYGIICYQTAWLKHNHPAHWLAAYATYSTKDARLTAISEAARSGIAILPPDVNESVEGFAATKHQGGWAMRVPLEAIHKMNSNHTARLTEERRTRGRFKSMRDLVSRCDWFTDRHMQDLVDAGACDGLGPWPATILRPHFAAIAADPRQRVVVASRDDANGDLLAAVASKEPPKDPEPTIGRAGSRAGITALSPEEVVARQEALLPGMFRHEKRQIKSTNWIKEVETLIDLAKASRIATKMPARTIAVLTKIGERESIKGEIGRVLMLTIEDDTGTQTYDVAPSCRVTSDLASSVGRTMMMTLGPAPDTSLISQKPQILEMQRYEDPLTQKPQAYPIVHVDQEIDDRLRIGLMEAVKAIRKPTKSAPAPNQTVSATAQFMLVVSPARDIVAIRLSEQARLAGLTNAFDHMANVVEVWE